MSVFDHSISKYPITRRLRSRRRLARNLSRRHPGFTVLFQVRAGVHHALRAQENSRQVRDLARADLAHPIAPLLFSSEVQDRAAPGLGVELEETPGTQARFPQDVMHVVLEPGLSCERGREPLVKLRARQGRQDRVARALKAVPRDEVPELPEILLLPI